MTSVRILDLSVAVLQEPATNPNEMDAQTYALLVEAIKKNGFLQPVLVRSIPDMPGQYGIIDGVHRVRAAVDNGMDKIACVVADHLAEDDVARLVQIGMNKMRGALDLASVATVLAELHDEGWSSEEMTITGYPVEEVDALIQSAMTAATSAELDGVSGAMPAEGEDKPIKPFVLELAYATRDELARAKKGLKKAAGGGKGADLAKGLLNLIAGGE